MYQNVNLNSCEIELTTKCNASCPQCVRNFYGGSVWHNLPIVDIDLDLLKKNFSQSMLDKMATIRLIGTYGDPIAHPEMLEIVKWLKIKSNAKLLISTNGGLRSINWWKKLAGVLDNNDRVMFCIDGLDETNHLYRKNVRYSKVIENLTAFNQTGGKSIWSMIVFKHNQHQVELAELTSKKLGCHGFAVKPTIRFIDKQHNLIAKFPVYNENKKIDYYLEPSTIEKYQHSVYQNYQKNLDKFETNLKYLQQVQIKCGAQQWKGFNIGAQGYVLPCGWLYDRLYGYEAEHHPDRLKLISMIEDSGGFDKININKNTIENILASKFFKVLEKSWKGCLRLERCASQCGSHSNINESFENIGKLI